MKLFIILLLSASSLAVFEPSEEDPVCLMCGDPTLRGFDGAYMMIFKNTKTLLTRYNEGICKFQVRCVTASTFVQDSLTAPIFVDWCGIAFHQHSNSAKYFRNWVVGQRLDKIGERGQGYSGITGVKVDIVPRLFPYINEDLNSWNSKVPYPICNPAYSIRSYPSANVIKFRSFCCGWAVDFYPRGRATCVKIYAQESNSYIQSFKGKMDGLCGNMDGNKDNDWRKCVTGVSVQKNTVGALEAIADSCISGKHDGQAYIGGTRLNGI